MAIRTGRLKQNTSISAPLDRRLLSYTLAAGATLAASTPSQAEVLFTPNNSFLRPPSSLVIDLNHDGVADFLLKVREIFLTTSSFAYGFAGRATVYGLGPSKQFEGSAFWALKPLKRGNRIGNQVAFHPYGILASGRPYWNGPFDNLQNRFLGVKLVVNGEVHFGWIGFRRVDARKTVQVTLAGWAYETEPGKAILAGDIGNGISPSTYIRPTSLEILSTGYTSIEARKKCNAN